MKAKILLVSLTAMPHHSAESIHIVMTANGLSKISDFELVTPYKIWRSKTFSKNLKLYGDNLEAIKQRKFLQLYPNDVSFLNKIVSKKEELIFYCRQMLVANFFLKKSKTAVLELHSLPSSGDVQSLKIALKNKNFIAIVVITKALKIDILKVIGEGYSDFIHVLSDAADINRFHYKTLNGSKDKLKVGYVGSNFVGKGWEIIEKLPSKSQNEFHIYGFLNEKNEFSNAYYYGKIPYSQIPDALDTFDIGLLPNQPSVIVANNSEIGKYTSPMKLFEYMASGKVIIASDIPVIREILKDNYNAILVPHNKPEAWIAAITKLNADRDLYSRLQEQAYKDVCSKYSYISRANKIVGIINKD